MFEMMFVSHFIDSCCLTKSTFSSVRSLIIWEFESTLSVVFVTVDEAVVDADDAVVVEKGWATKFVWRIPPFWISATVQISKISFAIFCLRSDSDFVKRRLFTEVAIASVRFTFSHSLKLSLLILEDFLRLLAREVRRNQQEESLTCSYRNCWNWRRRSLRHCQLYLLPYWRRGMIDWLVCLFVFISKNRSLGPTLPGLSSAGRVRPNDLL